MLLAAVAAAIGFAVLLVLARHTGHRLSAILGLKWADIDFTKTDVAPHGSITWYAGLPIDNKKREHVVPMNKAAHDVLKAWRGSAIKTGWLFVTNDRPPKQMGKDTPKRWLRKCETLAELDHVKGDGWHAFRRGWATARKHLPPKDVAAAGGWNDIETMNRCYVHSTEEGIRDAALHIA